MKSIRRCQHIVTLFLLIFIIGIVALVVKINTQASYFMTFSDNYKLGKVYDRSGDVLFDGSGGKDLISLIITAFRQVL